MYDTFTGYVKKGINSTFGNPILFMPLLFNLLLTVIPMGLVFLIFGTNFNFSSFAFPPTGSMFPPRGAMIGIAVIVGLIMMLFSLVIYAGRYNMIKQAVVQNEATMDDFWEGIKKYTGRIFLSGLLVFGALLLLFAIVMISSMGIRMGPNVFLLVLLIVPIIIVSILTSFWHTILVYEDCGVVEALKLSWTFVKKHFGLVLIFNIIKGILSGNGNNNNNNRNSGPSFNFNGFINFNIPFSPDTVGLFSAIAIFFSAIKAFFALYFDVIFFLIYHDRRSSISDYIEEDFTMNSQYEASNSDIDINKY